MYIIYIQSTLYLVDDLGVLWPWQSFSPGTCWPASSSKAFKSSRMVSLDMKNPWNLLGALRALKSSKMTQKVWRHLPRWIRPLKLKGALASASLQLLVASCWQATSWFLLTNVVATPVRPHRPGAVRKSRDIAENLDMLEWPRNGTIACGTVRIWSMSLRND